MAEIANLMQEEGPIVQPIWKSSFTYLDKKVKNFKMHPTALVFGEELAVET
jgi:peptide/nickel transport system substrate-binding protein